MKEFFLKHRRALILASIVLILVLLFTTTSLTLPRGSRSKLIDQINTCSVPTGEIVAHGIDVSKYQGDIDFESVKADGYSFVILRAGVSEGMDTNFESNYEKAVSAGLDVGCYFYTYATTTEEIAAEARQVLKYIKGKTFSYPVFLDFEFYDLQDYDRYDENTAMINKFCTIIKRGGFYPGVYTSNSIYDSYIDCYELGNKWDFWIACYVDHSFEDESFKDGYSMWQYSDSGSVSGIDGNVDLDVCYVDYPALVSEFKENVSKYIG